MRDWTGWWSLVVLTTLSLLPATLLDAQPTAAGKGGKRLRSRSAATAGVVHVVQPGETAWSIAREHNVPLEALVRANRLGRRARIRAGQRLMIPLGVIPPGSQEPPSMADIVLRRPPEIPPLPLFRPVPGGVASRFGPRGRSWHGGVDLRAERGTPVVAAAPGLVIKSGWERAYGNVVKIWHMYDIMTVYAHNLENRTKVGDWVERGQVIATVGSTGRATAPHLHFEVRLGGRKYDPVYWIGEHGVETVSLPLPNGPTAQ